MDTEESIRQLPITDFVLTENCLNRLGIKKGRGKYTTHINVIDAC